VFRAERAEKNAAAAVANETGCPLPEKFG
jgi:hypothetical protein